MAFVFMAAFSFLPPSTAFSAEQDTALHQAAIHEMPVPGGEIPGLSVRGVITKHLAAIRLRDKETAYKLSSGAMQKEFEDAGAYFRSIRFGYKEVYDHTGFDFSGPDENAALQKVVLKNRRGESLTALIRATRNETGQWRVDRIIPLQSENDPL